MDKKISTSKDDVPSNSSSHTQYFRQKKRSSEYDRITSDEFVGVIESISGSSDTYRCVHGPKGKQYTQEGLLRRNLIKELDPAPLGILSNFIFNNSFKCHIQSTYLVSVSTGKDIDYPTFGDVLKCLSFYFCLHARYPA